MSRVATLLYGVVCYLIFLAVYAYLVGFLWSVGVPKAINDGAPSGALALLCDLGLIALFGLQHSVMARPSFKSLWITIVPPAAERSTYVLLTSGALALLFWGWQPMPAALWDVRGTALGAVLTGCSAAGWILMAVSTFLIDHFALFGLKQTLFAFLRRELLEPEFMIRGPYRVTRHPLMLGFLIAVWTTPWMTGGHLLFAAAMTAYMLIGLHHEERDLLAAHGEAYAQYQRETPMLLPRLLRARR